jgi:hypothetical protein
MNLFVNLAASRELATVLEVLKDNSLSHSRQKKKKKKKRKKFAKMAATATAAATELPRNTKFLTSCQDDSKGRQSGYMASTAAAPEAHRVRTLDLLLSTQYMYLLPSCAL